MNHTGTPQTAGSARGYQELFVPLTIPATAEAKTPGLLRKRASISHTNQVRVYPGRAGRVVLVREQSVKLGSWLSWDVKALPTEMLSSQPGIPWSQIARMRDHLAPPKIRLRNSVFGQEVSYAADGKDQRSSCRPWSRQKGWPAGSA
jgi:hypothetical protein